MGERLPLPIKSALAERDDAASLARVRGRIDARLDGAGRSRGRVLALAFAAIVLLAVGFAIGRTQAPVAVLPAPSAGPLPASPTTFVEVATIDGVSRHVLGDGSSIELAAHTELRVREARPELLALSLERGDARFVVAKRPERAFRVEAGKVVVTVRGTAFRVARSGEGAVVSVDEGLVEVTTPDGTHTVAAGARLAFPPDEQEQADASAQARPPETAHKDPAPPAWRPLARAGDYPAAYAALGTGGVVREAATATDAETLFSLADVARLSGHPREAVTPLTRLLADHGGDSRASLAAFTLAKIELEQLGDPRAAARHFEEALRLRGPATLSEDASARRVEAYARAGEAAKARASAAEHRAKYPGGRYDAEVARWASGAP